MKTVPHLVEVATLKPAVAFLVYTDGKRAAVTQHAIQLTGEKGLEIISGVPADTHALIEVARLLAGGEERSLLPEHVLATDPGLLMWWRPSQRRSILFRTENKATDALHGKPVLHPALLFMAAGRQLYVFALGDDARPTADTKLYRAPYFNLFIGGLLCEGNFAMPEHCRISGIEQWEEGFFDTNFAHTHLASDEVTSHPNGHLGLWRELAVEKGPKAHKAFPTQYLVPLTESLVAKEDQPKGHVSPPLTVGRLLQQ